MACAIWGAQSQGWALLQLVGDGDWILVTNNVDEFRRRYARHVDLHAGAVFLANVDGGRAVSLMALNAALDDLERLPDLVNTELLVTWRADQLHDVKRRPPLVGDEPHPPANRALVLFMFSTHNVHYGTKARSNALCSVLLCTCHALHA